MVAKLYIGNLAYSVTDRELRDLFSACGDVKSAQVITDRGTGQSKGFGFIELDDDKGASAAIEQFNGYDLKGRKLVVNVARPRN